MPLRTPRKPTRSAPREPLESPVDFEGADEFNEVTIQEWLEPIGNTGFYQSPLEPVDPYDCDRWPDSPYCDGGQPFNSDFIALAPIITRNACETCITIAPTLARLSLPPYTICKRSSSPECRFPAEKPPETREPEVVEFQSPPNVRSNRWRFPPEKQCIGRVYRVEYNVDTFNPDGGIHFSGRAGFLVLGPLLEIGFAQQPGGFEGTGNITVYCPTTYGQGFPVTQVIGQSPLRVLENHWHTGTGPRVFTDQTWDIYDVVITRVPDDVEPSIIYRNQYPWLYASPCLLTPGIYLPPESQPPIAPFIAPPYGPPEGYCCMACCQNDAENTELLRLIAKRLGTDQYPASVPKSLLTDKGRGQQQIESLTELLGWFIQQVDGLVGEFPIDVTITDSDPTKKGNQTEKVRIPNIAEAVAELYGLALKNSVDSDVAVSFLMRLASETIATKNAALITQDYARANAQFLGYKGNNVKRRIPYAFNPEGLDSLETILQESSKFIVGWEATNDDTLLEFQQRLMFAAGIIKAVFFRGQNNLEQLKREVTNIVDGPENEDGDERWREYLRAINNSNHRFNTGNVPKPKIKDLQTPEDITKLPTQDPSQK